MIRELDSKHLDNISELLEQYCIHINEETQSYAIVKEQIMQGQKDGSFITLIYTEANDDVPGFLVYNTKMNRIHIIFANKNFQAEKALLNETLNRYAPKVPSIIFESGYPTPWISNQLSDYAIGKGFEKHDRGYMRLEPINVDSYLSLKISDTLHFFPFVESMSLEISKLVFKCVDGSTDQAIFPTIFGSIVEIENFLHQLLLGQHGIHKDSYSWILKENSEFIGACFMITRNGTGFLIHIVIKPEQRRRGLGRKLLLHSIQSLLKSDNNIKRIELAVTWANPARRLYEFLGFYLVDKSSTFVLKM